MSNNFERFRSELDDAQKAMDVFSATSDENADEQFASARKKLAELREQLVSPLERKLQLREQYESQKKILTDTGILETLSTGELGIKDKDGNEYPFPEYLEIRKRAKENKEILERKSEQGFTKLLITPFAVPLDELHEKLIQNLRRHSKENKILELKTNPSSPDVPVSLDEAQPIDFSGGFPSEGLVYEPEEFSEQHNGKTKDEVISQSGAWQFSFIENLPVLPGSGGGRVIFGRKQVEAWLTPEEYLQLLRNPEYKGEVGTTPEDWVAFVLDYLEETDQLIDDPNIGKASFALGAYFPNEGTVPNEGFVRAMSPSRMQMLVKAYVSTCRKSEGMIYNSTRTRVRI